MKCVICGGTNFLPAVEQGRYKSVFCTKCQHSVRIDAALPVSRPVSPLRASEPPKRPPMLPPPETVRKRGRIQVAPKEERTADNIVFASKREMRRYLELRHRERAGIIEALELQVEYPFVHEGVHVCSYFADFRYREGGVLVVNDSKGHSTEIYKLKKKMMKAFYNIDIKET